MLVTFSCNGHENVTMFGDVALQLLTMMGHSGTVPSALLANDVPEALARLQQAIMREKNQPSLTTDTSDDEDKDVSVSLANRALPLVALLQNAVKKQCDVFWEC